MMAASASRRALLGGIAVLPALTLPAPAGSSDLISRCDWAIEHHKWIDRTCLADAGWPDERMDEEIGRYWKAFDSVNDQPSVSLAEIAAKARLALHDMEKSGQLTNADPCIVLASNVLEELIARCA